MKTRQLHIYVDEHTYQLVRLRAFYDARSIGDIVREAITKHVKPVQKEDHDDHR